MRKLVFHISDNITASSVMTDYVIPPTVHPANCTGTEHRAPRAVFGYTYNMWLPSLFISTSDDGDLRHSKMVDTNSKWLMA